MKEFLLIVAATAAGSFFTWLFSRPKNKAEVRSIELSNIDKEITIWQKMVKELKDEITGMAAHIDRLEKEIIALRKIKVKNCNNCEYKKASVKKNIKKTKNG